MKNVARILKKKIGTKKNLLKKQKSKKSLTKVFTKKTKKGASKILNKPTTPDPAHRPGHRKLNRLDNFTKRSGSKVHIQESAVANGDKVRRIHSANRRIVTGATIGKTGRIIIKE